MALKYSIVILILCTLSVIIFVTIIEQNFNIENRNSERVRLHPARFPDSKLMDLRDFKYVISATCNASALAWIVTSYSGDPATRSALRRAYPNDELQKLGIHRVFLLGMLSSEASRKTHVTQDAIFDESLKFKDIVQGNFQEAYRNLTYKHLMGLRWAVNTCHHANYIMKMDDDIVVNIYDILNILQTRGTIENTLMGYVLNNMLPIREPANKWFVTQEEFALNVYPEFLSGWLYITSSKIAEKFVSYAQVYPKYFWIDDLFITGILRNDLKIGFQNIRKFYATDYRYLKCCIKGKEKRLKCEFAIGPNGGNAELQVEFKDFAQLCRTNCSPRTEEFSVNNTCIVAHEEPNWVKGRALIEPVRML